MSLFSECSPKPEQEWTSFLAENFFARALPKLLRRKSFFQASEKLPARSRRHWSIKAAEFFLSTSNHSLSSSSSTRLGSRWEKPLASRFASTPTPTQRHILIFRRGSKKINSA